MFVSQGVHRVCYFWDGHVRFTKCVAQKNWDECASCIIFLHSMVELSRVQLFILTASSLKEMPHKQCSLMCLPMFGLNFWGFVQYVCRRFLCGSLQFILVICLRKLIQRIMVVTHRGAGVEGHKWQGFENVLDTNGGWCWTSEWKLFCVASGKLCVTKQVLNTACSTCHQRKWGL